MTTATDPLPPLRPIRLQGKAYYTALRGILKSEGPAILATLNRWRAQHGGVTVEMVGALALKHELNLKATCEFLADSRILPCDTYGRITRSMRPTEVLRAGREWLAAQDGDDKTTMAAAFERAMKEEAL